MVCSNKRKLMLSGWLKQNGAAEYDSPLKLQKFLLFYESFAKVNDGVSDFDHLKGYKKGPVFSNVLGDYTHERESFDDAAEKAYSELHDYIVKEYAEKSRFLVSILSEKELSDLTHKMNLWKSKKERIMSGEKQVPLDERDFNEDDAAMIRLLDKMYPVSLIKNSQVIRIDNHYFLFDNEDINRLSDEDYDVLSDLSENEDLTNPVYVSLDEEGRLIID